MKAAIVTIKPSRNEAVADTGRRQLQAAREAAMDAVCTPVRMAGDARRREAMARKVVRYSAIVLAAQVGVKAAAQHLAALAGQMFDEADEGAGT